MVITTAAAAEDLPVLIIDNNVIEYEILSRLPAKSICRFKSVSKCWNSFLSTRTFANMHLLQHHINNPKKTYKFLLIDKPPADLCRKPLNHGPVTVGFNRMEAADPRFNLLLASLDGLVCLASTRTMVSSLALWNPLTRAYFKLPSIPNFKYPFYLDSHVIGLNIPFKYSDSSNDYKLLYLVCEGAGGAYIYSQRLNSCRKIEFFASNYYDDHYLRAYRLWSQPIFCDHSLYFLVTTGFRHHCIICFDVNTEDFRVIQSPCGLPSGATRYLQANLVVMDRCIHFCAAYLIATSCATQPLREGSMWKLNNGDDGTSSWVEVAFFPGAQYDDRYFITRQRNICMTRNAQDAWLAISEIYYTSFQIIMSREEFTLTEDPWLSHIYRRIIYHETLMSPNPPSVS